MPRPTVFSGSRTSSGAAGQCKLVAKIWNPHAKSTRQIGGSNGLPHGTPARARSASARAVHRQSRHRVPSGAPTYPPPSAMQSPEQPLALARHDALTEALLYNDHFHRGESLRARSTEGRGAARSAHAARRTPHAAHRTLRPFPRPPPPAVPGWLRL